MARVTYIFFWGYALMLVGVGSSGTLIAPWELAWVFGVDLPAMGEQGRATLLNQYRFLKAVELAFGLFCVCYRREIFRQRTRCTYSWPACLQAWLRAWGAGWSTACRAPPSSCSWCWNW